MSESTYFIDKSTYTFADNLAALGLAYVVNAIANDAEQRAQVRVEDGGSVFKIVCEPALKPEWVAQCRFFSGAPFLITYDKKTGKKAIKGTSLTPADLPEAGGDVVVDYEAEKQNNAIFFDWRNSLSNDQRKKALDGELKPPTSIHPDWDLFSAVCNTSSVQGYNTIMANWWRGKDIFAEMLITLLSMASQTPNDLEGTSQAWQKLCKKQGWKAPSKVTALQLLNPAQGKGTNNTKAVWDKPENADAFWLLEWLKIVGLKHGGVTRTAKGGGDRKTYVLAPKRLSWEQHIRVMGKFRRTSVRKSGLIQMDIFATLRYTQALIEHYEEAREEDFMAEFFDKSVGDLVSGLQMAYYKKLKAVVTMNIATLSLPRWVRPSSREALAQLHNALDEHLRVVRALDNAEKRKESQRDVFELLTLYRDFLSSSDLSFFFRFATAYGNFIISQRERNKYAPQFTTQNLEVLMSNTELQLSRITQSQGFKNIAYAIRMSTVEAQRRNLNKNRSKYQVRYEARYGLGQELVRKASYRNEFLKALSEFVQNYLAENARVRERLDGQYKGAVPEKVRFQFRRDISMQDIDEILALMDEYNDSHMIASLLVAYGYASTYQRKDDEPAADLDVDVSSEPATEDDESGDA